MKKLNGSNLKIQSVIFLLTYFVFTSPLFAQPSLSPQNVTALDSSLSPTEKLLGKLSGYKFILIGEMHGTAEPVNFARQLALAIAQKKHVKFGFEIPADKMKEPIQFIKTSDLQACPFFAEGGDYGMASQAWFNTILELTRHSNIDVFFFDNNKNQMRLNRDSAMFLNIKQEYLKDTNSVIITVSGNVHNQLEPFRDSKTMGYFISTYLSKSILSVDHLYESGTMYNNKGDGAKTTNVQFQRETFKSVSSSPNYFYLDAGHDFFAQWNAFLFTTKINASYPVKNK